MAGNYTQIEDFGNFENIIKKFDPAFNDMFKGLPAQVANQAQGDMSMVLRQGEDQAKKNQSGHGLNDFEYFLMAKGV
jgi:hypothetical protein